MATTSTPSLHIAAVALILMCVGAAAQAPGPSPSKRMAPGPSSYAGKAPEPSSDAGMAPQPMAPSPAGDQCFTYVLNMSDCLSYVQDGSKQTVPDKPCCPEMAGLLDSHPLCLCELVGSAATYGVNVSKALTLPGACNIATPPLTLCPGPLSIILKKLILVFYFYFILYIFKWLLSESRESEKARAKKKNDVVGSKQ